MKQKILLKTMLLLCALVVGSVSAWAEDVTTTYVFTSKSWAATCNGVGANWTSGKDGAGFSNNGIQVTTNATGANGTSPGSFTNVTKIVATYNTNKSKGAGSIVAKIGSNDATTNNVAYSGSADGTSANFTTEFNYTTPQSGNVKLTVNTTTNSIYLVSVAITTSSSSTPTCATPTFSPAEGTYTSVQNVTISTETSGATIYYTTNGNTPTTESSVYSSPINVSETTTIKAIAVKEGNNNSDIATADYTINLPYSGDGYVRVNSLDYLTDGAKVIIAARYNSTATSYYAMTAAASGKPTGVSFTSTTTSKGEELPSSILDNESTYYWTVGVTSNGYTFTNSDDKVLGYTSSTNFAEDGDNTEWTITRATSGSSAMVSGYEGFYITNKNTLSRGIALNSSHNYGPYATSNNNSYEYNFYLDIFVEGATPASDPSIIASDVNIAYDATSGSIAYGLENGSGNVSAEVTNGDWLTLGTITEDEVPFTCSANTEYSTRTAVITLAYGDVMKEVTVTQAAVPKPSITASDVNINYDTMSGSIGYTLQNGNGNVTASVTSGDWLTLGTITASEVPFTCSANPETTARTATVTLCYTDADDKIVTVTQAAAPEPTITVAPATVEVDAEEHDGTLNLSYENLTISYMTDFGIQYYDAEGGETADPDWIEVLVAEQDPQVGEGYVVSYVVDANDGEARTAYFKVWANDDEMHKVYSELITISQQEYVYTGPAELPFTFDDGKGKIENTYGLTQEGLGSDYASSPKLKFDSAGDWLILNINETPGILTFDIKGYGLTVNYKFTVLESANGTDYTILKEYTSIINDIITSEELKPASTTRYIKWEYTSKSSGNVGLGNIVLDEPVPTITIAPATIDAPFAGTDGTLTVTYENIPDPISFDLQFCDANGDELQGDAPDWIDAEINEPTGEEGYSVSYIIGANNGEARTAYFKVYTFVGQDLEEVYSNLVTITQAAAPEPSITVDPATVTEDAAEHDGTLDLTYENLTISDMDDFDIQYYDAEGEEADEPEWIEVLVAEQDPQVGEGCVVSYVVEANDGEARTAYFKVWALNGTTPVYSDLVTITQAAYVAPGNWIETPLADINANDVFVIVGNNGDTYGDTYAMSNDKGTSNAPDAVEVTVAGNTLSGTIADNIKWNISGNATDGYTFYPNGTTETWLYCTNTNNGVRVGTNNNKTFTISDDGYLCNVGTSRYIGIYNSQDWRCYTGTTGNIADQTFAFYKKLAAKLNGNGYATFSATVPVDFSKATDFTAWAITEITGTSINFSQITGAVPAGTGVLLKGTANEFVYPATATSGTFTGTNLLEAVTAAKVIQANEYYGLSGNTFKKVGAGTVPAGKALLPVLAVTGSNTGSSRLTFVFEDATGIATIEHSPLTIDRYYDMQGRRVDNPKKGMYIVNGKKVVIK